MAECFCCSPFCGMWFFPLSPDDTGKVRMGVVKIRDLMQSENLYLKCLEETIEIGTRSCRNGTELVERKRSKNRKKKGRGDAVD